MFDPFSTFGFLSNTASLLKWVVEQFILLAILIPATYFLASYLLYRIARKFGKVNDAGMYMIPFFRYVKIMWLVGCEPVTLLGMCATFFIPLFCIAIPVYYAKTAVFVSFLLWAITIGSFSYFWSRVAKAMNSSTAGWAVIGGFCQLSYHLSLLFFSLGFNFVALLTACVGWLPDFIFAFDKSLTPGGKASFGMPVFAVNATPSVAAAPSTQSGALVIVGVGNVYSKMRIPIESEPLVIGRDPAKSQLVIENPSVSRSHLRLRMNGGDSILIEDLGSSNGSFRVTSSGNQRINGSAVLSVGDTFFVGTPENRFMVAK